MHPADLAIRARSSIDGDSQAKQMVRGYLALAKGDAREALHLLAADRLAEINARSHLRLIASKRRARSLEVGHG